MEAEGRNAEMLGSVRVKVSLVCSVSVSVTQARYQDGDLTASVIDLIGYTFPGGCPFGLPWLVRSRLALADFTTHMDNGGGGIMTW